VCNFNAHWCSVAVLTYWDTWRWPSRAETYCVVRESGRKKNNLLSILCLCCPVFRQRPCDQLITRPRSPTVCKMIKKLRNQPYAPKWEQRRIYIYISFTKMYLFVIHPFTHPPLHLLNVITYLLIHPSIHPFIHPSVHPSFHRPVLSTLLLPISLRRAYI
jgi:hypothetical protein